MRSAHTLNDKIVSPFIIINPNLDIKMKRYNPIVDLSQLTYHSTRSEYHVRRTRSRIENR